MQSFVVPKMVNNLLARPYFVQFQSVRFFRKPKWVPIAKSKMYRVIEHVQQPQLEVEEFKQLTAYYRLYCNSIWAFQKRISKDEEVKYASHAQDVSEDVEFERILMETERDNAIIRSLRQQQAAEEWAKMEQDIKEQRSRFEEEELKALELAEQRLQAEMERLSKVIKMEDLDQVIEKALSTEVDYNFGIDKDGRVYRGRCNNEEWESMSTLMEGPVTVQIPAEASLSPVENVTR